MSVLSPPPLPVCAAVDTLISGRFLLLVVDCIFEELGGCVKCGIVYLVSVKKRDKIYITREGHCGMTTWFFSFFFFFLLILVVFPLHALYLARSANSCSLCFILTNIALYIIFVIL
uniref:Uncharacterized protein n=1 Tax=Trypanosoma congolense (strain IL3000) TaxID=1068625 RepID=F9W660_TRYCI|nr:hypothetical protein, unlikely [Trypanosoma congolense IL3000]